MAGSWQLASWRLLAHPSLPFSIRPFASDPLVCYSFTGTIIVMSHCVHLFASYFAFPGPHLNSYSMPIFPPKSFPSISSPLFHPIVHYAPYPKIQPGPARCLILPHIIISAPQYYCYLTIIRASLFLLLTFNLFRLCLAPHHHGNDLKGQIERRKAPGA